MGRSYHFIEYMERAVLEAGGRPQDQIEINPTENGDGADDEADDKEEEDEEMWPEAARAAVEEWSAAVATAQVRALRFKLRPGQALLVDNFRMLHGRDPYHDLRRKLWRLLHWTDAAVDVPGDPVVVVLPTTA